MKNVKIRRRRDATRYIVGRVNEIPAGKSLKFIMPIDGSDEECFVINHHGRLHAYVNRCCHIPLALDWVDNQFFTADGRFVMCQTHNACYVPESGECVEGPGTSCGKFLTRIPLEIANGIIYAQPPEGPLPEHYDE